MKMTNAELMAKIASGQILPGICKNIYIDNTNHNITEKEQNEENTEEIENKKIIQKKLYNKNYYLNNLNLDNSHLIR